jgi:hypothetical protein
MCFDVVGRPQNATASTRNERPQARHQPAPAHGRGGESFARSRRRCAMPAGSLQRGGCYGGRGLAEPIERISFVPGGPADHDGDRRFCRCVAYVPRSGRSSVTNQSCEILREGRRCRAAGRGGIDQSWQMVRGSGRSISGGSPPCNGLSTRYPHIAFRTSEMFAGIILP